MTIQQSLNYPMGGRGGGSSLFGKGSWQGVVAEPKLGTNYCQRLYEIVAAIIFYIIFGSRLSPALVRRQHPVSFLFLIFFVFFVRAPLTTKILQTLSFCGGGGGSVYSHFRIKPKPRLKGLSSDNLFRHI